MSAPAIERSAVISDCERYRYYLRRQWGPGKRVLFSMLNPSKADHEIDDPTATRCIGFARAWGFDGVDIVNGYGWRATDPNDLTRCIDPVGPDNDQHIALAAANVGLIIAAWGASLPKGGERRMATVKAILASQGDVYHLGLTKAGHPRHPLYLKATTQPVLWARGPVAASRVDSPDLPVLDLRKDSNQ